VSKGGNGQGNKTHIDGEGLRARGEEGCGEPGRGDTPDHVAPEDDDKQADEVGTKDLSAFI
jgi:hypothetical protein